MSPAFHVREARKDEISSLVQLSARAFRGRPFTEALFPDHLRTYADEEHDFRAGRHMLKFDNEDLHYIIVADDEDHPVGWSVWQSPSQIEQDPEVVKAAKEKAHAACPKGLDRDVLAEIERAMELLENNLKDELGEERYKNAWYLDALAVDPAHQRKGIGRMLMQWGHDQAAKEHKDVRLLASENGAKLYRSLGYEEVGSLDICGGREYAFVRKAT